MSAAHPSSGIFPIACDNCSHAIRSAEDGMLLWLQDGDGRVAQSIIVHTPELLSTCVLPENQSPDSVPLWELINIGGLIMLCEMLKAEPDKAAMLAEIIERLHVPGFDRARFLSSRA